ncbi:MAG: tRNA guanosine(15) transglycosylase TgtA [Desulfurococcales archaeon]|nr:tRNA guanosine(15) transglycosylase TgtA [Desulfurococcales archaeon]
MFEAKDADLAGRIGKLYTKTGVIETPAFFPVVDVERQEIPLKEIRELGFNQVITNAYILYKRYREKVLEQGVHSLLGFNGVIMTDSGAYQILQYGSVDITNKEIIEFEGKIGVDIGVILDIPTGDVDRLAAERSVSVTLKRVEEARRIVIDYPETLWVLPVQGGKYLDLVEYSAKKASELEEFSIYGIGSPTVFLEKYDYRTVLEIVVSAKKHLKPGKPVHLFGAGHPLIIPYAVALGVDLFDSASYILYARDDRVFTDFGVERLDRITYLPCRCGDCPDYNAEKVRNLPKKERIRILARHNLCMIKYYLDLTKQAIKEGRLWEFLESLSRHHVRLYEAFRAIYEMKDYYSKYSPRVKGVVRGIRAYDYYSMGNPRLSSYHEKIQNYTPRLGRDVKRIILAPLPLDPDHCPEPSDLERGEEYILYYDPFLIVVPQELCGVYPTIHVHRPDIDIDKGHAETVAKKILMFLNNIPGIDRYSVMILQSSTYRSLSEELERLLKQL